MITYKDLILYHHGIKGQQWGVRRGPPYPIEDRVLKKGTRVSSVMNSKYLQANKDIYTYNPDDEWDSAVYKGPFSSYSRTREKKVKRFIYEHSFEVADDLKMATSKERLDNFIELYKSNPKTYGKELKNLQSDLKFWYFNTDRYVNQYGLTYLKDFYKKDFTNMKSRDDYKAGKFLLDFMMEDPGRYKLATDYRSKMAKKYDAMVDDHNVNMYNNAHDPIILFVDSNRKWPVKELGIRKVKYKEMQKNMDLVREALKKQGKTMSY